MVYWDEGDDQRILFTAGTWLYALNAETGKLISSFGRGGRVSLNKGLGRDPDSISVRASSPGAVYQDLLIMGSAVGEGRNAAPGDIRTYNVKTGEITWTFHMIPRPGEPGTETWHMDAELLKQQGGANNWAGMSVDTGRGIVYIPLESPVYDFYGGNRAGKNLYGNSLLALDAATDAAGAIVDSSTIQNAEQRSIDASAFLENNDSHHFHEQMGTLLKTGSTGNNVMNIVVVLLRK